MSTRQRRLDAKQRRTKAMYVQKVNCCSRCQHYAPPVRRGLRHCGSACNKHEFAVSPYGLCIDFYRETT